MAKKTKNNSELSAEDLMSRDADAERVNVSTSITEVERFSVSLPVNEARQLREAAKNGSISQKVRDSIKTRLFCEDVINEGGVIYAVTKNGELKRIVL